MPHNLCDSINARLSNFPFKVPRHGNIPESKHFNFYKDNISVVVQDTGCVIRHPEEIPEIPTDHIATTIGKNYT